MRYIKTEKTHTAMKNAIEKIEKSFGNTIAYKTKDEVKYGLLCGIEVNSSYTPETGYTCGIWLRISIQGFGPTENNFISIHSSDLVQD